MDKQSLLNIFDDDAELMQEMIDVFLKNAPTQLAAVREAVEIGDAFKVERSAHALKGSLSIFDFPEVFDAALRLEAMGRIRDLGGSRETLDLLAAEVGNLQTALVSFA